MVSNLEIKAARDAYAAKSDEMEGAESGKVLNACWRAALEAAIVRERESIIACIRTGSWSGTEEIVSFIKRRN